MPLFVLLGIYTGRRKEAILSLRWSQVDLEAGLIDFETPGRERTKKRRGKVPIPAKLLPHLKRARKRGSDLGNRACSVPDARSNRPASCRVNQLLRGGGLWGSSTTTERVSLPSL